MNLKKKLITGLAIAGSAISGLVGLESKVYGQEDLYQHYPYSVIERNQFTVFKKTLFDVPIRSRADGYGKFIKTELSPMFVGYELEDSAGVHRVGFSGLTKNPRDPDSYEWRMAAAKLGAVHDAAQLPPMIAFGPAANPTFFTVSVPRKDKGPDVWEAHTNFAFDSEGEIYLMNLNDYFDTTKLDIAIEELNSASFPSSLRNASLSHPTLGFMQVGFKAKATNGMNAIGYKDYREDLVYRVIATPDELSAPVIEPHVKKIFWSRLLVPNITDPNAPGYSAERIRKFPHGGIWGVEMYDMETRTITPVFNDLNVNSDPNMSAHCVSAHGNWAVFPITNQFESKIGMYYVPGNMTFETSSIDAAIDKPKINGNTIAYEVSEPGMDRYRFATGLFFKPGEPSSSFPLHDVKLVIDKTYWEETSGRENIDGHYTPLTQTYAPSCLAAPNMWFDPNSISVDPENNDAIFVAAYRPETSEGGTLADVYGIFMRKGTPVLSGMSAMRRFAENWLREGLELGDEQGDYNQDLKVDIPDLDSILDMQNPINYLPPPMHNLYGQPEIEIKTEDYYLQAS